METIVRFDGEQFLCKYYYDWVKRLELIEVYLLEGRKYIGVIDNIRIPDAKDSDKVKEFENKVSTWLKTKDTNYTMSR